MSFCLLGYPKENRFSCCKNHTRKIFLLQNSKVEWAASLTGEKSLDFSPLPFSGTTAWSWPLPCPGKNPSIFPLSLFRDNSVEWAASLTGEKSLDFSPLPFPGQQREMGRFPDRGKIPRFFPSHFFRGGSVELAASMANATKRAACSLLE